MQQQVLGDRYELEHLIGSGGMADVYLARDRALGRPVAVKLLHTGYAADPIFVERFRREAQAAAGLSHPDIVAVYDWGEIAGPRPGYYIVMQYVPGENLREVLVRRGALPEAEALGIAAAVAEALGAAHRQGIVHRDIKPHNILIDPQGRVKVVDFGIARAAGASQLTQTGTVAGTAQYLSPEQAQRLPLDGRSDLYSLGVVLYEMLTGRPPFEGDSIVDLALRHTREAPVPPRRLRPDLSPATEAVVLRALAKDPEARFPTAQDMRAALLSAQREVENAQAVTDHDLVVEQRTVVSPPVPAAAPATEVVPEPKPVRTEIVPPPVRRRERQRTPAEHRNPGLWLLAVPLLVLLVAGGFALAHLGGSPSHSGAAARHPTAGARATTKPAATPATHRHRPAVSGPATAPTSTPQPAAVAAPKPAATNTRKPAPVAAPQPSSTSGPQTTATAGVPSVASGSQSSGGATSPTDAVAGFYTAVATHQWNAAEALWTPHLAQACPPAECISGHFMSTSSISLHTDRVVKQSNSDATVAVDLTVNTSSGPAHYTGTWNVVHGPGGWLLDSPNLTQQTAVVLTGPPDQGKGHGKAKGHGQGQGNGSQGDGG